MTQELNENQTITTISTQKIIKTKGYRELFGQ